MNENNHHKKKILLVYPGRLGLEYAELPLSILYLGAYLEAHGIPCELVDMRFTDYRKFDPNELLCVGVSTMTGTMIKSALDVARYFKSIAPDLPIVWGGVHPSMLPEQTLKDPNADIVVIGEGEETMLELVGCLQMNEDLTDIRGIGFKKVGAIIINPPRDFIDMDKLPIELPYHKLELDRYFLETFPVHTSRGCPYGCRFCYNPVFNRRRYRVKSPNRVLDEIEYIVRRFNPKKISFTQDDEFFIDLGRVRAICKGLIDRNIHIQWESFCRLDSFLRMDDEMLRLVEKSGCRMLSFGGESGNQKILDMIEKGSKVEYIPAVAQRMASTRIDMVISFMMGLPGETYSEFLNTCNLIERIIRINPNCNPNGLFLYTPYPGTKLMQLVCERYDYRMAGSLEEWAEFRVYRNENMPWLSRTMIKRYKYISILTRFPFLRDNYLVPVQFDRNYALRMVYHFYSHMARFRWRKKWFSFPLELMLLERILERKRGYV